MSLSLNKIFPHAGHDLLIRELTLDSRNVRAGDLFLAVPGDKNNINALDFTDF